MKKVILCVLLLVGISLSAQRKKDETVYYTDSRVKDSRFGMALNLNPYYTTMRLINEDGSGDFFSPFTEVDVRGGFAFDYGLDLFYDLAPSFQLSIGFGRSEGHYTLKGIYVASNMDTLLANDRVSMRMYTIPFKINFRSSITETFDLEVMPMIQLNLLQSYQASFSFLEGDRPDTTLVLDDRLSNTNLTVGIALGGTFWLSDHWGMFTRISINYMLNNPIPENWPRETLLSMGGNLGMRYRF